MATLNFKTTTPNGGWRFFEERTRATIRDDTFSDLVLKVIAHRQYKNLEPLDPPTVALEIERQLCTRLSARDCTAEGISDEWTPIDDTGGNPLDMWAVLKFSQASAEWLMNGLQMVADEEAQRRRGICASCPLNSEMAGCSCGPLYGMINSAVPENKRYADLNICAACSCSLKAKVWLPMSFVDTANDGRKLNFPAFCWQNPASENFVPDAKSLQ